jgi:hypothetical protein
LIDWNDTRAELIIYLLYGMSFIVMYITITMWNKRVSHIQLMDDFRFLAIFALLHGLTEYSNVLRFLAWQPTWLFDLITLIFAVSSFTALLSFGISVITSGIEEYRWLRGIPLGAIWMYFWLIIFVGLDFTNNNIGINYQMADLAQRYTLGFLGALITSYAFIDLSGKIKKIAGNEARRRFVYVGIAFGLYTIFSGLIVTPVFDVPIVVYRSMISILMTLAVIRIFQLFEVKHETKPANSII